MTAEDKLARHYLQLIAAGIAPEEAEQIIADLRDTQIAAQAA